MNPTESRAEGAPSFDPEALPTFWVSLAFWFFCLVVGVLIFIFTPHTYQLDDIKILVMHVGGMGCLLAFLTLWLQGEVDAPPKWLSFPWIAFVAANWLSCLAMHLGIGAPTDGPSPEFNAAMRNALVTTGIDNAWFYLTLSGFVFLGAAVLRTRRMAERALRFWLLMALATTFLGLFHYGGGMGVLYKTPFIDDLPNTNRWKNLVYTFMMNRTMLSTILNEQFFGNFLVMLMPASMAAIWFSLARIKASKERGEDSFAPFVWIAASGAAFALSAVCMLLTFQKSSTMLVVPVVIAFFVLLHFGAGIKLLRIPYLGTALVGTGALLAGALWLARADLQTRFITMEASMTPRRIMFGAAWQQFLDYPILGACPGSFRILFPTYRDPDFHLFRIANVTNFSHNWALDMLCEVGIVGFGAYVVLLGALVWFGWRAIRTCADPTLRVGVIGMLLGIGAILVANLATPMTRWPIGGGTLHAFIGTAIGIIVLALRGNRPAPRSAPLPWDATRIAAVVLLAVAVPATAYVYRWQKNVWEANKLNATGVTLLDATDALGSPSALRSDPTAVNYISRAIADFNAAIKLDPNRPTTHYKLAYAYNRMDELQKALEAYMNLQQISPDYSEINYNLGVIYHGLSRRKQLEARNARDAGDTGRAEAAMREARTLGEKAVASFARAAAQARKANVYRYWAIVTAGLSETVPDKEAAELSERAGDILTQVLELPRDPGSRADQDARDQALVLAPGAYRESGNVVKEAQAYERIYRERPGDSAALADAARAWVLAKDEQRALALLDEALVRNPFNPTTQMTKYQILQLFDSERARAYAKYLLALQERVPDLFEANDLDLLRASGS